MTHGRVAVAGLILALGALAAWWSVRGDRDGSLARRSSSPERATDEAGRPSSDRVPAAAPHSEAPATATARPASIMGHRLNFLSPRFELPIAIALGGLRGKGKGNLEPPRSLDLRKQTRGRSRRVRRHAA